MTQAHHTPLTTFASRPSTLSPHPTVKTIPESNSHTRLSPLYPLLQFPTSLPSPHHFTPPHHRQGQYIKNPEMMMLRAPHFSTIPTPVRSNRTGFGIGVGMKKVKSNGFAVVAALQDGGPVTGVVFQPFEEVKSDNFITPISQQLSLARHNFVDACESAINEQINVEYSASYVYHSLFAYFDRDNVALKGFAKFFKESSMEERDHADKLMTYQNKRGGKVKLHSILMPSSEFEHPEKGDALHAMELALSLEKLVNEKLLYLHSVAQKNNDHHLQDFIEGEFLTEQVSAIKKVSEYVTQLRMVGKGHGVWHFDQMFLN